MGGLVSRLRHLVPTWAVLFMLASTLAADLAFAGPRSQLVAEDVFQDTATVALVQAAAAGDTQRIRHLQREGADLDTHGSRNITPLQWTLLHGSPKGLKVLLEAGADPEVPAMGDSPIVLLAAKTRDPIYLRILLEHGIDPSRPRPPGGQTPLMAALMNGNSMAQFQTLLDAGADPNQTDRVGDTPLHVAAGVGAYDQILALLEAGANPLARNVQDASFQTYLAIRPASGLTARARKQREAIDTWLRRHKIPIEKKGGS